MCRVLCYLLMACHPCLPVYSPPSSLGSGCLGLLGVVKQPWALAWAFLSCLYAFLSGLYIGGCLCPSSLSWNVTSLKRSCLTSTDIPLYQTRFITHAAAAAAAAAKSLQSCLTLCDPTDGSAPGSPRLWDSPAFSDKSCYPNYMLL